MSELEGTRSAYTLAQETCSGMAESTGKACQRLGVGQTDDGRWWCGLHHPDKKAERQERKLAKKVAKVAKEAGVEVPKAEPEAAEAPPTEFEEAPPNYELVARSLVTALTAAMNSLNQVAFMRDTGWPENTHAEKYRVLLREANSVASSGSANALKALAEAKKELKNNS